ncbi:interleukin-6-like isoform X2 [Engraulis encrasicolus]|uniref:interleukin-6-like isoform X2 n=1 Tax=Engraulis encrasicolus TaxID=184585 RepID=UPI002FCFB475
MPSQLSFLFSALLAAALSLSEGAPLSTAVESADISGDESHPSNRHPVVSAAYVLHADVDRLLKQFQEQNSQVKEGHYHIQSPINSSADGCFSFHFNKFRCLKRIYAGLHQFEDQMQYVNRELESQLADGIIYRTRNLQRAVKEMQQTHTSDDTFPKQELPTESKWMKMTVVNGILQSYKQFLIYAHRALRHMSKDAPTL